MIDDDAMQLALRAMAAGVVVCTTGSTTLSATANGYGRDTGSFITDRFAVGMELVPAGFSANTPDVITAVSALSITVANARAVEAASSGRSLTVGLPQSRAWQNKDFTPTQGRPYIEDEYLPGGGAVLIGTRSNGTVQELPVYVVRWYGLADVGLGAIRRCTKALLDVFAPATPITSSVGDIAHVRTDPGPWRSGLTNDDRNYVVCTLTVPLRAYTVNPA